MPTVSAVTTTVGLSLAAWLFFPTKRVANRKRGRPLHREEAAEG
jgi:hypothetical protein